MKCPNYSLYQKIPGLVLGFHGCDKTIGQKVISGKVPHLLPSTNTYDWLGDGIYFWEDSPQRAWEFAQEQHEKPAKSKGHIAEPFVVGAVIDLGLCLNLMDRKALDELIVAHKTLELSCAADVASMPVNKGANFGARYLDRAVMQTLHSTRAVLEQEAPGTMPNYDSVRSAFPEGNPLYAGAGFQAKNHIQIAVRSVACIKGYFRPLPA